MSTNLTVDFSINILPGIYSSDIISIRLLKEEQEITFLCFLVASYKCIMQMCITSTQIPLLTEKILSWKEKAKNISYINQHDFEAENNSNSLTHKFSELNYFFFLTDHVCYQVLMLGTKGSWMSQNLFLKGFHWFKVQTSLGILTRLNWDPCYYETTQACSQPRRNCAVILSFNHTWF